MNDINGRTVLYILVRVSKTRFAVAAREAADTYAICSRPMAQADARAALREITESSNEDDWSHETVQAVQGYRA